MQRYAKDTLIDVLKKATGRFRANAWRRGCSGPTLTCDEVFMECTKIVQVLRTVSGVWYQFRIFACKYGQRKLFQDFVRERENMFVASADNKWDLTVNVKSPDASVIVFRRLKYAGMCRRVKCR